MAVARSDDGAGNVTRRRAPRRVAEATASGPVAARVESAVGSPDPPTRRTRCPSPP